MREGLQLGTSVTDMVLPPFDAETLLFGDAPRRHRRPRPNRRSGARPDRDHTFLNPQTSYSTQKAIGELLVNNYSRKGMIDGRGFRLPTISVRPG